MKLHFLKYDALASLRANVEGNLEKYRLPVNDWIYEFFGEEEPFGEFMTTVGDISLVCTEKEQGKADVQNVITLYSAMMNITDTQASDERLWAGMCHGDMWEFLNKRWEASSSKKITKEDVLSRYFYGQGRRRSLITNTLAKLWWVGRLTYDPDRKDPFELTHYFEDDFSRKTLILFSSNYMSSRPVALGLLSALNDLERETASNGRERKLIYQEASKYLNILGGTMILDYFTKEEIEARVKNHILSMKKSPTALVKSLPRLLRNSITSACFAPNSSCSPTDVWSSTN